MNLKINVAGRLMPTKFKSEVSNDYYNQLNYRLPLGDTLFNLAVFIEQRLRDVLRIEFAKYESKK